jgi:histone H3/H4
MANEPAPKLLWNPENVKDVAESVGIGNLNEEALKALTQDVEYRVGQVIIEALRLMRAARRTTLTVNDVSLALKVLDVEPLYGYDSTRPLRFGEASLGPGQPLFYIEDEEMDFEKLINAPLPKIPRDMNFTGKIGSTSMLVWVLIGCSALARYRRRSALDSSKSDNLGSTTRQPLTEGSWREPSSFCTCWKR